jgi:hypothetical protein
MRKWCTNCDEFDSASLHVCRFFTPKKFAKILLWFFLVVMAVVVALNKRGGKRSARDCSCCWG